MELAESNAAYQATSDKLTEAVSAAAGAQAELRELRAQQPQSKASETNTADDGPQSESSGNAASSKRKRPTD